MKIEKIEINKLKPATYNPRQISTKQYKDLKSSVEKFGLVDPIITNKDFTIIGGHQRYKICKELKHKEIDCVVLDLSKEEERELNIRLNKNTGDFDMDILANEFDIDELVDWGFKHIDLDINIDKITEGNTEDDHIPEVKESRVKLGDVWELGKHRLICGDSTKESDVEKLMNGQKADMVFTDPPYNINFKPQRGTHDKILNDSMNDNDFSIFLDKVFNCCKNSLKDNTYLFVWSGWSTIGDFKNSLIKLFDVKALHIWVKNNFGIGYYSRPKYEPFFLCLNGKPIKPKIAPADVWEYAKVHKTKHSCEKPVGLILEILNSYFKTGLVLDVFLGSGSTLIACEKTNRICYGMELDTKYCDVIIERWEQFTGQKATKL
jgi:DNA modification methylase